MSDKETKGAYLPFRELLLASHCQSQELMIDCQLEKEYKMVSYYEKKVDSVQKSLRHYDELLRIANMEEVK